MVNAIGWHIVLLIFSVLKTAFSNKVQLYLFKIQVKFMQKYKEGNIRQKGKVQGPKSAPTTLNSLSRDSDVQE